MDITCDPSALMSHGKVINESYQQILPILYQNILRQQQDKFNFAIDIHGLLDRTKQPDIIVGDGNFGMNGSFSKLFANILMDINTNQRLKISKNDNWGCSESTSLGYIQKNLKKPAIIIEISRAYRKKFQKEVTNLISRSIEIYLDKIQKSI